MVPFCTRKRGWESQGCLPSIHPWSWHGYLPRKSQRTFSPHRGRLMTAAADLRSNSWHSPAEMACRDFRQPPQGWCGTSFGQTGRQRECAVWDRTSLTASSWRLFDRVHWRRTPRPYAPHGVLFSRVSQKESVLNAMPQQARYRSWCWSGGPWRCDIWLLPRNECLSESRWGQTAVGTLCTEHRPFSSNLVETETEQAGIR